MTPLTETTPLPSTDEDRRLAALQAMALLDSEPEGAFDALVALTAQRFDCPVSMLNLIDRDWGKVQEYQDVTGLTRVQCADAAGVGIPEK